MCSFFSSFLMSFWNFLGLSGAEEVQKPPAPVQEQRANTVGQRPQSKSPGMVRTTVSPSVATGGYSAPAVPLPRRMQQQHQVPTQGREGADRSSSISSNATSRSGGKVWGGSNKAPGGPSRFTFVNKAQAAASTPPQSAFGFLNRPPSNPNASPKPPPPPPPVARTPSPSAALARSPAGSIGRASAMGFSKVEDSTNNGEVDRPLQQQSPTSTAGLNTEVSSSRKLYRDEKTQLSVRRKSKLAEYEAAVLGILKSASRESDVVKQLKDVLDRQNRLVEEERYEEASELDTEVAAAREVFVELWRGMAERAKEIQSVEAALRALDEKWKEATVGRTTAVREQLAAVMSSGKEAGASGDDDGRLQLQRSVLEADMRTLEEMKTANAAEEAEVKAAREAVEDAIKEVTGPIDEERQQVDKQRIEVEERIRKLQEELAQLKTTRDECNEKLSRLDGDIVAARGKFRHELDNVEVAEEKFDKKTKAMVLKEELIEQQRKAIEQRENEIHQRREEDLENRRALEEELDALDTSHKVADRWLACCDKLGSAVEGSVGVIVEGAELRASLRRQVTDVAEQLSTLDLEIGRVRAQLNLLQQRRLQIEEEKQQAVRSRRFGEAKNLSAEGKTVEESIATTEESIRKLRDRSTALRQQLDEAQSKEDGLLDGSTDVTGCGDVLDEMAFGVKARLHYVGEVAEGEGLKPEADMLEALDAEIAKHLPSEVGEKLRVQMAALVDSDTRAVSPQGGDTAKPSESSEGEPLTSGDDVGATGSDSCALQSSANDDVVDTAENDENFRKETVELEHEEVLATRDDVLDSELASLSSQASVDTPRGEETTEEKSDVVEAGEVEEQQSKSESVVQPSSTVSEEVRPSDA